MNITINISYTCPTCHVSFVFLCLMQVPVDIMKGLQDKDAKWMANKLGFTGPLQGQVLSSTLLHLTHINFFVLNRLMHLTSVQLIRSCDG